MLECLQNPPKAPIELNGPGIQHSISTYITLEHASQKAYDHVIASTKSNFLGAPGVNNCLKFHTVKNLIAAYTGIEPVEHNMCTDSCVGFTGPFADLTECPICSKSQWNEARLEASNGWIKLPAKTFTTLPLGPQLQALYRNSNSTHKMHYLCI